MKAPAPLHWVCHIWHYLKNCSEDWHPGEFRGQDRSTSLLEEPALGIWASICLRCWTCTGLSVLVCSIMQNILKCLPYSIFFSFPCYEQWIPNLNMVRDQMNGNSLGIYLSPCILYTLICSTPCQCTWFGSRIQQCSFILSWCQETKDKGGTDWNNRGKSLKKEDTHLLKLLIILYTLNPSCLRYIVNIPSIRHEQCTMDTT